MQPQQARTFVWLWRLLPPAAGALLIVLLAFPLSADGAGEKIWLPLAQAFFAGDDGTGPGLSAAAGQVLAGFETRAGLLYPAIIALPLALLALLHRERAWRFRDACLPWAVVLAAWAMTSFGALLAESSIEATANALKPQPCNVEMARSEPETCLGANGRVNIAARYQPRLDGFLVRSVLGQPGAFWFFFGIALSQIALFSLLRTALPVWAPVSPAMLALTVAAAAIAGWSLVTGLAVLVLTVTTFTVLSLHGWRSASSLAPEPA